MSSNQQTIDAYNAHVDEYIQGTPQKVDGHIKIWIDKNLGELDLDSKILEVGSAFGRDADYMESKGYKVEKTDASKAFVDFLQKAGKSARVLDLLSDDLGANYDMIFADAVILHFKPEEVKKVVSKVFSSLAPSGRFVFSIKQGEGEEMTDRKLGAARYFCYWQPDAIKQILISEGFNAVEIDLADDYRKDRQGWLLITAKKAKT